MTKEQANKLKLSDKVICNKSFEGLPQKGWIGKVVCATDIHYDVGIEWEKPFILGHDCGGVIDFGKKNHCRWYGVSGLENERIDILSIYNNNQLEFEF